MTAPVDSPFPNVTWNVETSSAALPWVPAAPSAAASRAMEGMMSSASFRPTSPSNTRPAGRATSVAAVPVALAPGGDPESPAQHEHRRQEQRGVDEDVS